MNVLTNADIPFNRRFMDTAENVTYLMQSVHNRSLDLSFYFEQKTSADPHAKQALHIQLEQDPQNATRHNLTLRFDPLRLESPHFLEIGPKMIIRDLSSNSLRLPFNSPLDLLIQFKNSDSNETANDDRELHLLINSMPYNHQLEMVFENASVEEFLEKKTAIFNYLGSGQNDQFIKMLTCEPLKSDLHVVVAGFSNFTNFAVLDLIDRTCAGENDQFDEIRYQTEVEPVIESFREEFGLKLKECSVKVREVLPPLQQPKVTEIWFDLAMLEANSSSSRPAANLAALLVSWLVLIATLLIGV